MIVHKVFEKGLVNILMQNSPLLYLEWKPSNDKIVFSTSIDISFQAEQENMSLNKKSKRWLDRACWLPVVVIRNQLPV